ncbi:UNVERIFIED_CONTAM: hypothetical protein GTU68_040358 [Idotea baltica]|nr:hypothetical protein [Idotea baltica]
MSSLMMTWLGQRSTLLVYLPIGMIFWITMSVAQSFWLLILSRIIQGVVIGVSAGCANNYVVETVHQNVRGRLFALIDMSRQVGFLFMYVVGSSQLSWRNVGLICGLVSMALPFLGMIFLPHSPRWLATHGRKEEARKALVFFRGENYDVDSELNDIQVQLDRTANGAKVWDQLKMLTERSIVIRFIILAVLLFASHFTGNFALIAYSVSIFESANVEMNPYLCTIIVACVRILGVAIYMTIADKFGRRPLLMIPLFLSGIAMVALGLFFFVQAYTGDTSYIAWLPLTSVIFYVLFTMMSHPVLMLLRSELLPTSVRAVGVGLLYLSFFCGSFGVSLSYPYMVDSVGSHWTFWLYGATSFMMVFITAVSIPETQGKSLEDIGDLFAKKKGKSQA